MDKDNGFTLIELVLTLTMLGILSTYVLLKSTNKASVVQAAQRELLIHHLRHAQALAMQWGQTLRFTISANAYSVRCVTVSLPAPCNTNPVKDPATGADFTVTLESGLSLSVPGSFVDFDALGRPVVSGGISPNDISWQLNGGGLSSQITIHAISGMVTGS